LVNGQAALGRLGSIVMYDALRDSLPTITERQRQVIELIAAGCSNDEVGERLGA